MELTQLRYFQKVARTKSITKAAQDLYISQPTLSQSLSRLESSLGCPLFTHQPGKRMQLNESGELFLKTVDRLFEELEHGIDQVRELNERAKIQVSIASSIHDFCEDLVLGFFACCQDAKISQRLVPINSLPDLLLTDEIDFAISPCPIEESPGWIAGLSTSKSCWPWWDQSTGCSGGNGSTKRIFWERNSSATIQRQTDSIWRICCSKMILAVWISSWIAMRSAPFGEW